jgi:hypothetical protein
MILYSNRIRTNERICWIRMTRHNRYHRCRLRRPIVNPGAATVHGANPTGPQITETNRTIHAARRESHQFTAKKSECSNGRSSKPSTPCIRREELTRQCRRIRHCHVPRTPAARKPRYTVHTTPIRVVYRKHTEGLQNTTCLPPFVSTVKHRGVYRYLILHVDVSSFRVPCR